MSLLSWILFFSVFKTFSADEGLYKSADDVVILTETVFPTTVLGSDSAWIVEFYNSWCGHCINFAPKWKEFATDIKGWQKVISVGAVDCSQKHNTNVCRTYDIKGYPALHVFPPNADNTYRSDSLNVQDINSIRHKLVDYISNFTPPDRPRSWPVLKPLSAVEKIWEEAKDIHKHVILIFENDESYVGSQVILDLSQYDHVLIRRVTNKNVAKFGVTHLPSVFLLHGEGTFEHIAKRVDNRTQIVKIIKQIIDADHYSDKAPSGDKTIQKDVGKTEGNSITNGTVVFMQDLESALSYSFRQEIAIHKSIEGEALQALKDYIKVLTKYFPGEVYIKKFLWRIKTWIDNVSSGLTGEVWVYYTDSLQSVDTYLPENIAWVGCKGSEPRFRGYPCAMWTLFHTLTVNAYIIGQNSPKFLHSEVLNAIADYMKYFFGCRVCSKHFLKMADNRQISSAFDQVLWLWRAHNMANKRLHGDQSEDPLQPKIIFPSYEACPKCRKGSDGKGDNPIWDETEVLNFLLKMYRKENIIKYSNFSVDTISHKSRADLDWWERMQRENDLKKIKEIKQMKRQRLEDKLKQSGQHLPVSKNNTYYQVKKRSIYPSGISRSDINMCVLFYGLCLVIIAILYYHFVMKKKMNPCKPCTNSKPFV